MSLRSAEFWRLKAEEALAVADAMKSIDGRNTMMEIARQYEMLARSIERLEKIEGGDAPGA
jgi:hypothetical protein